MGNITRRDFLKSGALGAAAFVIAPNTILGKSHGHIAPSDKLNIAGIGVGGVGRRNLKNMSTENIVALCDVDWAMHLRHSMTTRMQSSSRTGA